MSDYGEQDEQRNTARKRETGKKKNKKKENGNAERWKEGHELMQGRRGSTPLAHAARASRLANSQTKYPPAGNYSRLRENTPSPPPCNEEEIPCQPRTNVRVTSLLRVEEFQISIDTTTFGTIIKLTIDGELHEEDSVGKGELLDDENIGPFIATVLSDDGDSQEIRQKIIEKLAHLSEKERAILEPVLIKYWAVFGEPGTEGCNVPVEHTIPTTDDRPIRKRPYRVPYHLRPVVEEHLSDMLNKGPDTIRFELQKKTRRRPPSLLWAGISNTSVWHLGYVGHQQHFKIMDNILASVKGAGCFVYLDDVVIASSSIEEHAKRIDQVLGILENANLKANLEKCHFGKEEVQYLGHVVSAEGKA
ncbi:hypothetical protein LSTR_LSTR015541 [Laodelphax striatellus]|uniref:Reverse transcriptase domain-containing protein n=1 Tax=Laodelphax striatellus TaxID=195883 RepID=A0A482XQM1_LAOST|nr:hypothetical protein LSTR_LSTR015541 [Laodelphax striatellus]